MQATEVLTEVVPVRWKLAPLSELHSEELYDVVVLRQRVFVVEQSCAYLDADGHDRRGLHLLGRGGDGLLHAYARLLPPGVKYAEASIGRVVVAPSVRRQGIGRALMTEALDRARSIFGGPFRIGAQLHLEPFYGEFGFVRKGSPYRENDIPHVEMFLVA